MTYGDNVSEGSGVVSGHLVQEGGDVTKGLASLGVHVIVEESDNTGNDGGRGGSTTDGLNASLRKNEDVGTEGSHVRESSSVRVVVSGRRKLDTRLEIVGNGGPLVSGLGSDVGETTTRGEVGLIEAYALLNSAGGTVKARAARRRVGEVGTSAGLRDLGGTDGGDVGGSGRENGVEVVLRAGRIGTSVSTRVSRGADEGDSTNTNLLEFGVDPLDVLGVVETELLALGSSNAVLALGLLVPSVRDGVDERNILGGKHVAGESVQPDVVLLDPEPSLSSNSNSQDVLDVEGSFDLGVGGVIVTNDVVGSHWRNVDGELGGEVGEIGGGEVLVLELDDTSGGVTGNLGRSSLVDDLDGLGGNGNQSLRLGRLLEGKARNGELAKSSNEFDVLGKVVGDGKLAKLTNELSS